MVRMMGSSSWWCVEDTRERMTGLFSVGSLLMETPLLLTTSGRAHMISNLDYLGC